MKRIIPYNPNLKELARKLRNNSSLPEILLWKRLSKKQLGGFDFHRQKPLLNFIADFYCSDLNLVIEVDGKHHNSDVKAEADYNRDKKLKEYGVFIYRIPAASILIDLDLVVENIRNIADQLQQDNKFN
jgi:very-short-patch-repair endonuclease